MSSVPVIAPPAAAAARNYAAPTVRKLGRWNSVTLVQSVPVQIGHLWQPEQPARDLG